MKCLAICCTTALAVATAFPVERVWVGPASGGLWHDAQNWEPAGRMTADDVAVFRPSGSLSLTVAYDGVCADLIACGKFHNIVPHKLIRPHRDALPRTNCLKRACCDKGQLVNGALRADLLKNTEHGIGNGNDQER